MIRLRDNWLLWQVVMLYGLFIIGGSFIPKPYISSGTAIGALIAGTLMTSRYLGTALDVLFKGKRGDMGSHNAVLGVAEFGVGLVYSGLFRLLWIYFDRPLSWSATVWSSLGLFMIAKGAYRLATSPDDVTPGHRFPEGFRMAALFAFGVVIAFVAGMNFNDFG